MKNTKVEQLRRTVYEMPTDYKGFKQYYKNTLQQKIDSTYYMASDTTEIEEEQEVGTLLFQPLLCRVNHAIEPKTGLNLGDDFKEIKFFDLDYPKGMGQRYKFDNSIWITVNTDNYRYITKSAIVRRCNNELRWINMDTGMLIAEPCIVDYSIKYANVYYNNTIDIPQGTLVIIVQYNENTKQIKINDRFVLGSHVYKVKTILDSLRSHTFEEQSVPLITLQVSVDTIFEDDNFTEGTSNYNPLYPDNLANVNKYSSIFNDNIIGNDTVVISPDRSIIYLGETVDFSCLSIVNGVQTDMQFNFTFSGVPSNRYSYTVKDGNNFSITNLRPDINNKLSVLCTSQTGSCSKELIIELGGVY